MKKKKWGGVVKSVSQTSQLLIFYVILLLYGHNFHNMRLLFDEVRAARDPVDGVVHGQYRGLDGDHLQVDLQQGSLQVRYSDSQKSNQ